MNILFITRFYPDSRIGGIERVTGLLAKYFQEQGIRVHCLYFEKSVFDDSLDDIVHAYHLEDLYDEAWIKSYLIRNDIKIVINQSHFFYTPFLSKMVHEVGGKLITCCHSSTSMKTLAKKDAVKQKHGLKRMLILVAYPLFRVISERKLKRIHWQSFEKSDKTIVLSESIKAQYASVLGIKATDKRLDYIYNPLSFEYSISKKEISEKKNIVLVVARLYELQKRLSLLFKVWQQVQRADWRLVIVGDGEDRLNYEQMAKDMNLVNVSFEGVQNPMEYYRKAKIFVMTSSWEGLPMTIIESFQMGVVPIVMDSFPAAKDMVVDGKNGFIINDGDVSTFSKRLQCLMNDDTEVSHLALEACASSVEYNISEIGNQWIKTFKTL